MSLINASAALARRFPGWQSDFPVLVAWLALFGLLAWAPSWLDPYFVEIGFRLLIYCVLAEAWNLMAGYCGLVSLGSSSFFGLGGYVTVGLLNHAGVSLPVALIAAALSAVLMATLVSRALFRLRGLYFTVGTLALAEALRLYVVNVPYFGGATGLFATGDLPDTPALFRYATAMFGIATVVMTVATRSRFAVLLTAVRDDEDAARQMGVRAFRVKLVAFAVASALIAAVGGLQAVKLGAIEPYGSFGLQWSVDALTVVIIGGMGMRLGAIVGAGFVIVLGELLADYPEVHVAITGVILVVTIRFAPRGICGLVVDLVARLRGAARGRSRRMDEGAQ